MRVMVIVKATKNSEAGVMPSEELEDFHEEMTPELREKEERLRAELETHEARSL